MSFQTTIKEYLCLFKGLWKNIFYINQLNGAIKNRINFLMTSLFKKISGRNISSVGDTR